MSFIGLVLGLCTTSLAQTKLQDAGVIGVEAARELIETKEVIIVDVRTPEEVAAGAIENAINLDYFAENFKSQISKLDKSKIYLVYCKKGGRSNQTLSMMQALGFNHAYDLAGGFEEWEKANK